MIIDMAGDPDFAAAVREGVREALLAPEFRAALFAHVAETAADYVWLTRAQIAEMLGKSEKQVARWAKKNLLQINDKFGPKQPLYSLASVQASMESGAIRARSVSGARKPVVPNVAGAPRRAVTMSSN